LKNNFGITYVSVAKESFFRELSSPVNKKRVLAAKKFFKGIENIKVIIE
jgi:hypothetical protein